MCTFKFPSVSPCLRGLFASLLFALGASSLWAQPAVRPAGGHSNPGITRLTGCLVSAIDEAKVPAQEAGLIVELPVVEGQIVKANEILAQIDDSQPRMQRKAALAEETAAREKAVSNVDIDYATAAAKVFYAGWEKKKEANTTTKGTVSLIELMEAKLQYERATFEIDRAKMDKKIAGLTADVKSVEVEAAAEAMKRRKITSPMDGIVIQINLHRGEWVKPGDPVFHVQQIEKLKVEGSVSIAQLSPDKVIDRKVRVEVKLSGNRKESFDGKIVFVNPNVQSGGEYHVKAEVKNRLENNFWLLQPGMDAEMLIDTR